MKGEYLKVEEDNIPTMVAWRLWQKRKDRKIAVDRKAQTEG